MMVKILRDCSAALTSHEIRRLRKGEIADVPERQAFLLVKNGNAELTQGWLYQERYQG